MNTEQEGSFRTRTGDDGSLEVWARGWRLESQLYALIPMALSLMFLVAPMSITMRAVGAVVMLAATFCVFRMTKPGLRLTEDSVSIISVVRTQRFPWEQVSGFMGERRHDEGRVHLILADERHIPLPGTLDPAELDPYGDEGELLSAADQLNRLQERALAQDLPKPAAPVVHTLDLPIDETSRGGRRGERKALRAALKAVQLTPEGTPERISASHAPDTLPDDPSRRERRGERRALRAALKAVQLAPETKDATIAAPAVEPTPSRRLRRRSRTGLEPAPELVEVTIAEPDPASSAPPVSREEPTGPASHYPTPIYIPQAEYAQMLRDQKAAEKAAIAAAAELRRLANFEETDELAKKEEFSDWTS
jgi:hypothetical protein